jgi:hypothetical protein
VGTDDLISKQKENWEKKKKRKKKEEELSK